MICWKEEIKNHIVKLKFRASKCEMKEFSQATDLDGLPSATRT